MLQYKWTLKTVCWVKEASYNRPHIKWFYSCENSEQGNLRQKVKHSCFGEGLRDIGCYLKGMGFLFEVIKICWWLYISLNILKNNELCDLNGWTVWHMNNISIRLFKKITATRLRVNLHSFQGILFTVSLKYYF